MLSSSKTWQITENQPLFQRPAVLFVAATSQAVHCCSLPFDSTNSSFPKAHSSTDTWKQNSELYHSPHPLHFCLAHVAPLSSEWTGSGIKSTFSKSQKLTKSPATKLQCWECKSSQWIPPWPCQCPSTRKGHHQDKTLSLMRAIKSPPLGSALVYKVQVLKGQRDFLLPSTH